MSLFEQRKRQLTENYETLINRKNEKMPPGNGVYDRYRYPVLTANHASLIWRYDFNPETNPYFSERLGVNGVFNPGAIHLNGKFYLVARVEGVDRKSFFAVAESDNGIDGFRFWDHPIVMPETDVPDTNVYDMRLVQHEDGWIYGLFCTERKDPDAPRGDLSSAIAQCGIARTKDLVTWERLDDLKTGSPQQRNVVLHPEFVDGKYAFYTRPQDGFIDAGSGGGIGWGLSDSIEHAVIDQEIVIDERQYHTIKEVKNGQGPAPIKTDRGWLHIAHGVRNTAARPQIRSIRFPFRFGPSLPGDAPSRRAFHRAGRRRTGGRRLQCRLLQRSDRHRRRKRIHLLRLLRYPGTCGHHHGRPAAGLRAAHAGGRLALLCMRGTTHPTDRP